MAPNKIGRFYTITEVYVAILTCMNQGVDQRMIVSSL